MRASIKPVSGISILAQRYIAVDTRKMEPEPEYGTTMWNAFCEGEVRKRDDKQYREG